MLGPKMVGLEMFLGTRIDPTKLVGSEAVTPKPGHRKSTKEGTFGTTSCGVCPWPKRKESRGSLSPNFFPASRMICLLDFSKMEKTPGDFRWFDRKFTWSRKIWRGFRRSLRSCFLGEPHLRCYHQYGGGTLFGFLQHFATHCEAWLSFKTKHHVDM